MRGPTHTEAEELMPSMGQVLLVRHGQASWGTDDYDVLSPLGWEQGRILGAAMARRGVKPDRVVIGGMRRHRETCEALCDGAGWGAIAARSDDGWDEFDHLAMLDLVPAPFEGESPTRAEFQAWFEMATDRWITAGAAVGGADAAVGGAVAGPEYVESFAAFGERVNRALRRVVLGMERTDTVLVITSGGPVATVAASLLEPEGARPSLWSQLNKVVVNTSVTKVVVGGRGTSVVSFNEHSHLEGDGLTYR
ncbi:histidine phosphatase family protein [Nocardioides dubius]|uniref:Histidine phosphatase family protein n=2 Tax=Nocardioides dubius TaxID=317019 RepID=A0ABN1TUU0_9ACTN